MQWGTDPQTDIPASARSDPSAYDPNNPDNPHVQMLLDMLSNGAAGGASIQANYAQQAMDQQRGIYDANSANYLPYIQGGQTSLAQLLAGLHSGAFSAQYNQIDPSQVANDPGYQFRMQQAQQALQRSAAAGGRLNSGAFMKGLDSYSQGLASQEYNNAFQRNLESYQAQQQGRQATYNNLYNLAGMGASSANQLGMLGQGYANSMSSLYGAKGNAVASQYMAQTSAGMKPFNAVMGMVGGALGGGGLGGLLGGGGNPSAGQQPYMLPTNIGGGGGGGYGMDASALASSGNFSLAGNGYTGSLNSIPTQDFGG